ncbi:hypothetical protein SAMN05446037_10629, partial [Anaerovirgula multivorans]
HNITVLTTIMGDFMYAISRLSYPIVGFLARSDEVIDNVI